MRITHTSVTNDVWFIGRIWQGHTCANHVTIPAGVLEERTRQEVLAWLESSQGDFQEIIDFRADLSEGELPDVEIHWEKDDSEDTYGDCMEGVA